MNDTIYLLKTNNIHLYTNFNMAIIKLLKNIKSSFENNLSFNCYTLDCYLTNSNIIYKSYYFNLDKCVIQDNYNNIVKLTNEYKYIQNNLINYIKNLYKNNCKETNYDKVQKLLEEKKIQEEKLKEMKENLKNETKNLDLNIKKKEEEENKKKEFDAALKSYFLIKKDIENNILNESNINSQFQISYYIFKELNVDIDNINENELQNIYYEKYKYYKNIDMMKKYLDDKRFFISIKNDIYEKKIYESEIPSGFILKFKIFNNMNNNKLLNNLYDYNNNHHNEIKKEYNKYVDICLNLNNYEPHNKNYIDNINDDDEIIQKIINKLNN